MRIRRHRDAPAARDESNRTGLVACFLRVDVELDGVHSQERYNWLSEQLQNQLQEAWLSKDPGFVGREMVCTTLGPLLPEDAMAEVDHVQEFQEHWRPIAEWRNEQ